MATNSCTFDGRLTKDVEIKTTQSGNKFGAFTVAHDEGFGDKKTTYFFECVCTDFIAENMVKRKMKKGSAVSVIGVMMLKGGGKDSQGNYVPPRFSVKALNVDYAMFNAPPKSNNGNGNGNGQQQNTYNGQQQNAPAAVQTNSFAASTIDDDEDLPF